MKRQLFRILIFLFLFLSLLSTFYYAINNKDKRTCLTSSSTSSSIKFVPVLILHPNLTYYSMLSIWQARQVNDEIHILYDHNATVRRTCNQIEMKSPVCFSSVSTKLTTLIKSLSSSKVYFTDLNTKYLQTNIESFKRAFSEGNNKSLFDQHHPSKWIYEEWCAVRWLYAYNYAMVNKFDVIYLQDSDVLLYSNVSMEFDYIQPVDTAISSSLFRPGSTGHNAFFRIKTLQVLINFMTETWHQRNDVAGYVRANVIPDTFYFVHLFEYRNNHLPRRAKGTIIYLLNDVYYSTKYNRSSGRAFDYHIGDDFEGRYPLMKITFPTKISDNMKNLTWITDKGDSFNTPHMSSSLPVRYPFIYHRELQENILMITLHFVGYRKKFMPFYTQRYTQNLNVDELLTFNFFPHKQLI